MRLLLRSNSHRTIDGGVEVAASPDTPTRPEPWVWNVRLLEEGTAPAMHTEVIALPQRSGWDRITVAVDPEWVRPDTSVIELSGATELHRHEDDVLLLIVVSGSALLEDRHALAVGDAVVFAGHDPLRVMATGSDSTLVRVHLTPARAEAVSWVP
jgi:hypothetical protein